MWNKRLMGQLFWNDWRKLGRTSVKLFDIPAKFRSRHLTNTSQKHYCFNQLLGSPFLLRVCECLIWFEHRVSRFFLLAAVQHERAPRNPLSHHHHHHYNGARRSLYHPGAPPHGLLDLPPSAAALCPGLGYSDKLLTFIKEHGTGTRDTNWGLTHL